MRINTPRWSGIKDLGDRGGETWSADFPVCNESFLYFSHSLCLSFSPSLSPSLSVCLSLCLSFYFSLSTDCWCIRIVWALCSKLYLSVSWECPLTFVTWFFHYPEQQVRSFTIEYNLVLMNNFLGVINSESRIMHALVCTAKLQI